MKAAASSAATAATKVQLKAYLIKTRGKQVACRRFCKMLAGYRQGIPYNQRQKTALSTGFSAFESGQAGFAAPFAMLLPIRISGLPVPLASGITLITL